MPRRNSDPRRGRRGGAGPSPTAFEQSVPGPDGAPWHVRTVTGQRSVKTYRCPGCDHEVRPGVAHVLAWPSQDRGGIAERRHWHTGCWAGRGRRAITRRWS